MRVIIKFFVIMVLLITNNNFGYFYYACVVKIIKNNKPQYIILFSDYHDKMHDANKNHRRALECLLKKNKSCNVKLIVEDLSSINNDGRMICCNYGINCARGVLGHLANKARALGICVDNVEYRYCRVASIGPLINNIQADPHSFRSSTGIKLGMLYNEIINEIEKIKRYDDGKKLNVFYKHAVAQVRNTLCKMKLCSKDKTATVAHYCAQLHQEKYRQKLENLCIFDSALIDINIMHSIMSSAEPIIFVVAGGSHIQQVHALLKQIDGQTIFATPGEKVPQPIDLVLIDTFISDTLYNDK